MSSLIDCKQTSGKVRASANAALASSVFFLFLKHIVTLVIQGRGGFGNRLQEDKGLVEHLVLDGNDDFTERWNRIVSNDMENIPLALIVQAIALLTFDELLESLTLASPGDICAVSSSVDPYFYAFTTLTSLYVFFRYAYTICYAFKLQPYRTIVWTLGNLSMISLAIMLLVASYKALHNNDTYYDSL